MGMHERGDVREGRTRCLMDGSMVRFLRIDEENSLIHGPGLWSGSCLKTGDEVEGCGGSGGAEEVEIHSGGRFGRGGQSFRSGG